MSNTIPDDVKNRWPDAVRLKMIERSEFYTQPNIYQYGFYDGYQLSREELEAKDEEIQRLESEQRITESQLIIAEDGVQRLKGLISQAWAQSKINCEVENGAGDAGEVYISWLQFCKDNNIT